MRRVSCTKSVVALKKSKIVYIDIEPNVGFDKDDFQELYNAVKILGNGSKFYHIIKVGAHTLPNKDACELSASNKGSEFKKADAFVVSTMAQKIMVDIMIKINRPTVPTKAFSNVRSAKLWIDKLEAKKKAVLSAESSNI